MEKQLNKVSILILFGTFLWSSAFAASIDWRKVSRLKDKELINYVEHLDLKGQDALDFWKNIPLSRANKQVHRLFRKKAFSIYMKKYPRPDAEGIVFTAGMGTAAKGLISGQSLKLPFSKFQPLPKGPIGNPNKTYKIGYTIHG